MKGFFILILCIDVALAHRGRRRSSSSSSSSSSLGNGNFSSSAAAATAGRARRLVSRPEFLLQHDLVQTKKSWELRICNAYGFESGLDAFHRLLPAVSAPLPPAGAAARRLTERSGPLPYGRCADLGPVDGLGEGSLLAFRVSGGPPVGSFRVSSLPARGSLLQLVVHRLDASSTAAGFSSHAFGEGDDPEVALVDAHGGGVGAGPAGPAALAVRGLATRWRRLRFGTAVSLRPGWYEWALTGGGRTPGQRGAPTGFRLGGRGRYTALRIGVDARDGPWYKEELVLFPTGWLTTHGRAGPAAGTPAAALLLSLGLSLQRV